VCEVKNIFGILEERQY